MSVGIHIDVTDTARPALARVRGVLQSSQLNPVVGRAVRNVYRSHLFRLDRERPNALGGERTNFYAQAARGTSFTVDPDGVTISIASIGIAQRFYGGVIRPKAAKWLTIPAAPEAHGKTARQFDLELVWNSDRKPVALATKNTLSMSITRNAQGEVVKRQTGNARKIMFWLRKSVTQNPDPTVLPPKDEVAAAAVTAIDDAVNDAIRRRGGPSA